jgi:hypothetical protein
VLEIDTLPLELVMLPIVVAPDPLFEIETPAALVIPPIEKVPEPAFSKVKLFEELAKVPTTLELPVPPTETKGDDPGVNGPETAADWSVTLPVESFVIENPPLLVKAVPLPLKLIAPAPEFVIASEPTLLITRPLNRSSAPPLDAC